MTTKIANHLQPSEIILNQQKPSKTTQKTPKATCTNETHWPPHRATSHQILPCFSAVDLEHGFIIMKEAKELGKNWQKSSNNHESQRPEVVAKRCSIKKSVLRYFTKFIGKHLCQSPFFNSGTGVFL